MNKISDDSEEQVATVRTNDTPEKKPTSVPLRWLTAIECSDRFTLPAACSGQFWGGRMLSPIGLGRTPVDSCQKS